MYTYTPERNINVGAQKCVIHRVKNYASFVLLRSVGSKTKAVFVKKIEHMIKCHDHHHDSTHHVDESNSFFNTDSIRHQAKFRIIIELQCDVKKAKLPSKVLY